MVFDPQALPKSRAYIPSMFGTVAEKDKFVWKKRTASAGTPEGLNNAEFVLSMDVAGEGKLRLDVGVYKVMVVFFEISKARFVPDTRKVRFPAMAKPPR